MTYQDDVAERRTMLDEWLQDTTADLTAARRALNQLTVIDGPQHLDVTAGITAALEAVAAARRALDHDPQAANTARICPAKNNEAACALVCARRQGRWCHSPSETTSTLSPTTLMAERSSRT